MKIVYTYMLLMAVCALMQAQDRKFLIETVSIPAGTFRMGNITDQSDVESPEKPVHEVTITRPFLMGRTEVTQSEWKTVMGGTPGAFKGDTFPIDSVNWYDAVDFCNRLSKLEGLDTCYVGNGDSVTCDFTANGYRLPTEAEWEYACRAGAETDFSTGSMVKDVWNQPALNTVGWYDENSGNKSHEVAAKEPNAFGLYDMHGNLWEWCWDWDEAYKPDAVSDPIGPASVQAPPFRIHRGGCWLNVADACRSSSRRSIFPDNKDDLTGFRVVRTGRSKE